MNATDPSLSKRLPVGPTHRRFSGEECDEIIRRAAPYYVERMCSLPYYAEQRDNAAFWQRLIGSRIVAAYELLVEKEGFSLPDAILTYPDTELSDGDRHRILTKPLWQALLNRDLAALNMALSEDADPNERHPHYLTSPLEVAINSFDDDGQRLEAVSSLLSAGADGTGAAGTAEQLLSSAYWKKDAVVMKLLLDQGADPNRLMSCGQVIYDHVEVDYRLQQYDLEVPIAPSAADVDSEQSWLEFLERIAELLGTEPPMMLRLLWDHGARPRVPLLERVSGSYEEQQERAAARFQAAVALANKRGDPGRI